MRIAEQAVLGDPDVLDLSGLGAMRGEQEDHSTEGADVTIQIDDAGWGCMIGGVLIGCYRVETGEFYAWPIPVDRFQGGAFSSRDYLSVAWVCAQAGLATLKREVSEPVQVCQGWVNQEIRRHLGVPGSKITGPFQARIEQALLDYLHGLGFPYAGSTEEYGKLFFESVRWLKGGNPNRRGMVSERVKVAKTGWATFSCYQDYPYREAGQRAKALKARTSLNRWREREDYQ